jgi:hypothetical protein
MLRQSSGSIAARQGLLTWLVHTKTAFWPGLAAMGQIAAHVVRKQLPASSGIPLLGGKALFYGELQAGGKNVSLSLRFS